jgi:hypothetical protein
MLIATVISTPVSFVSHPNDGKEVPSFESHDCNNEDVLELTDACDEAVDLKVNRRNL